MEFTYESAIRFVSETSPEMMETLLNQVYSNAMFNLVSMFLWAIVAVTFFVGARKAFEYFTDEGIALCSTFAGFFVSACCLLVSLIDLQLGIQRLINPEYYAIKLLFEMFPK